MYSSLESIDRRIKELEDKAYYHANFGSSYYESQCDAELLDLYAERSEILRRQEQEQESKK